MVKITSFLFLAHKNLLSQIDKLVLKEIINRDFPLKVRKENCLVIVISV